MLTGCFLFFQTGCKEIGSYGMKALLSLTQKFRYLDIKITMYTDLVQTEMLHLSKDTVSFYVIEMFLSFTLLCIRLVPFVMR